MILDVSLLVEKKISNTKVPIPVVIEKVNGKTALEITEEIEQAKVKNFRLMTLS